MKHTELFLCECGSPEHQFVVSYWDEDDAKEVYVDIHLTKATFWKRVWYAIKYIFGYQSKYGAFDEIILNPDDAERLQKVVDHLRKCVDFPGLEGTGIPGKDFVPVDWVETLEKYGKWKIVQAKEEKEKKLLTEEEFRWMSDELYKKHPWYMQKEQKPIDPCDASWDAYYQRGYERGLEVGRKEQKPTEWSEEDEHRITDAIYFLESAKTHYADTSEIKKAIAWLNSLRPQSHWKPSEEQMGAVKHTAEYFGDSWGNKWPKLLKSLYEDLKKL